MNINKRSSCWQKANKMEMMVGTINEDIFIQRPTQTTTQIKTPPDPMDEISENRKQYLSLLSTVARRLLLLRSDPTRVCQIYRREKEKINKSVEKMLSGSQAFMCFLYSLIWVSSAFIRDSLERYGRTLYGIRCIASHSVNWK